MKIEDQVCSLELAKRLKELGVKQDSIFRYDSLSNECKLNLVKSPSYPHHWGTANYINVKSYSAFTVAELMDLFPACINMPSMEPFNNFWLQIEKRITKNIQYILYYKCDTSLDGSYFPTTNRTHNESLANALAERLIELIEKNLIDASSLGKEEEVVNET